MITDSFDNSRPIINPQNVVEKQIVEKYAFFPDVIILTFSEKLIDMLIESGEIEILGENLALGDEDKHPIFKITGTNTGIFHIGMGALMAAGAIEQLHALFGCKRFIIFGHVEL